MYPNASSPSFGVFVANFAESFKDGDNRITQTSLIKGRQTGILKILAYLRFFADVFWKSNFGHYDLIYVHYIQHSVLPLNFWWNRSNRKLVLNAHGTDIVGQGRPARFFRRVNRKLILNADLIVVPSAFFVSKIEKMGVERSNIFVSPSGGIDPSKFFPPAHKELSLKIGYLGRLDPGKGLEILLESFTALAQQLDLRLEIVGSGSLLSRLQHKVADYSLDDSVSFFGVLKQDEVGSKLREWDLLIFPSELEESLGLVGLEAMACGTPVIGSNQGGILTYLENGKNGFTFESGNFDELTRVILAFYNLDTASRTDMSERALATASEYLKTKVFTRLNNQLNNLFNA